MDTKTVKGFALDHGGWVEFDETPDDGMEPWQFATLVIGKGDHPDMMLKSEVTAILREAICSTNDRGAVDVLTIINIAERNGLKP